MHWDGWHMQGWHMGGMWLFWVVLAIVVFFAAWLVVRMAGKRRAREGETPEDLLKKRYAKGEISSDEYQHKLAELRH